MDIFNHVFFSNEHKLLHKQYIDGKKQAETPDLKKYIVKITL